MENDVSGTRIDSRPMDAASVWDKAMRDYRRTTAELVKEFRETYDIEKPAAGDNSIEVSRTSSAARRCAQQKI